MKTICDKVHKAGGRFIEKRDDSSSQEFFWDEIEVRAAHLKTSQALRDIRSDLEPQSQKHAKCEQVSDFLADASKQGIASNEMTIGDGELKNDSTFEHDISSQVNSAEGRHRTNACWDGKLCRNGSR